MNQLERISQFRADLAIAETFEEIKLHDTAAAAMAEFAKRQKMSAEKQNEIGIFRIEVEAKKGLWLIENFQHGGVNSYNIDEGRGGLPSSKMPATKKESARARNIAESKHELLTEIYEQIKKTNAAKKANE